MKVSFNTVLLAVLLVVLSACSRSPNPEPGPAPTPIQNPGKRPDIPKKRVVVALAFGQSNSANSGGVRANGGEHVYNFYRGKLYGAQDPLLGATGRGGSVWTRLGRKLIAGKAYDTVVFVSVGVGGSEIARWTPGGDLHPRVLRALKDLQGQGLTVTHLLWHQGEADNLLGTDEEAYKKRFLSMLGSIRKQGVDAPIYVSTATRYRYKGPNEQLRQAQLDLVNPAQGIYAGPDTDKLGEVYRYDGTHFTDEGLDKFADLWLEKLGVKVSALPKAKPTNADTYVTDLQKAPTDRLSYDVAGVRAVDIIARNAFAVDDVAFSE